MQDLKASRRTARIDPDRRGAGVLAIMLVVIVMGASMAFSFKSLRDTAEWTPAPEWARTMAPLYIDGAILAFTVALALFRWRRHDRYARSAKRWLYFSTLASMLLNGLHTAAFHGWDLRSLEMYGGVIIASGAPLFALVSAEQIIRLVFQQPEVDEAPGSDAASGTATVPGDRDEPMAVQDAASEPESGVDLSVEPAEPESTAPVPETEPEPAAAGTDLAEELQTTDPRPMPVDHDGYFVLPPADAEPGSALIPASPENVTPLHLHPVPDPSEPMSVSQY